MSSSLADSLGQLDIYLVDQLLKDRIRASDRVLDAGCGSGRNIYYLMRMGCDVSAIDIDPRAVGGVQELAAELETGLPAENFRVEAVEHLSFPPASFDVVISSAVLHFARDAAHFDAMIQAMWRVLRPGGLFFARLASTLATPPDGPYTWRVSPEQLEELTAELGGQLLDPIKTSVVHDPRQPRGMTTWVVRRGGR